MASPVFQHGLTARFKTFDCLRKPTESSLDMLPSAIIDRDPMETGPFVYLLGKIKP